MTSRFESAPINVASEALPEIEKLAKDVLNIEKYGETKIVTERLLQNHDMRKWAQAKLIVEIGYRPTRPLYYLMPLLQNLPHGTRDCIRYAGDYLDLLTKEMTFECIGGKSRHNSLGKNAFNLKKAKLSPEIRSIAELLLRYGEFLYTPGKHDFTLPPGRDHRFTVREVVLTIYVTAALGNRIKLISKGAQKAVDADNLYIIGGRWGTKKRVEFAQEE
jgi:hypothetical protein